MKQQLTISATEANRSFSKLLREVGKGTRVTVTAHGRPVAIISPPDDDVAAQERVRRLQALEALKDHWSMLTPITVGPWTRAELYERE